MGLNQDSKLRKTLLLITLKRELPYRAINLRTTEKKTEKGSICFLSRV